MERNAIWTSNLRRWEITLEIDRGFEYGLDCRFMTELYDQSLPFVESTPYNQDLLAALNRAMVRV